MRIYEIVKIGARNTVIEESQNIADLWPKLLPGTLIVTGNEIVAFHMHDFDLVSEIAETVKI